MKLHVKVHKTGFSDGPYMQVKLHVNTRELLDIIEHASRSQRELIDKDILRAKDFLCDKLENVLEVYGNGNRDKDIPCNAHFIIVPEKEGPIV